ncbi:MAG: hypothetical protein WCJ94_02080 [bacterium]
MKHVILCFSICALFFSFSLADTLDNTMSSSLGIKFPSFSANNLSDVQITVPEPITPKVEMAVMTFARQEIDQTDAWINTFNAIYKGNTCVAYSQTAVLGDIPVIGGLILGSLKGNIDKSKWERFLIYTGDKDKIIKPLQINEPSLFYVYVIGKDGLIKWMVKSTKATDSEIISMLDCIKKELNPIEKPKIKKNK